MNINDWKAPGENYIEVAEVWDSRGCLEKLYYDNVEQEIPENLKNVPLVAHINYFPEGPKIERVVQKTVYTLQEFNLRFPQSRRLEN